VKTDSRGDLVPLARITKTHALVGEFRAHPLSGESENLGRLASVVVRYASGATREFVIERARPQKGFFLMKLAGVDRIEDAEKLIGLEILAPAEVLSPLDEGEFYWYQLVGLTVVTHDARPLGRVESLFATGSNDVLVVKDGERERLIPYTDDAVESVDLESKTLRLKNLDGIEDL
jgi:16S rRNA processing protein RimM